MTRPVGLLLLLCSMLAAFPSRADVTRFELSGSVTDGTGASLPGVTVTIRNLDTGLTQTAPTDERGLYRFAPLDPKGRWSLTAELAGFRSERQEGLTFTANTEPRIDFRLDLGGVEETITVSAQAPVVETRTSDLKQSVGDEQVANLPNNGRDFLSFVELSGSAVRVGGGSGNISINGQGIRSADFVSDGTSITGREIRTLNGEFGGGNGLSLDTIEEVQVISNGFKAEVGRTGAGTVNIITKSGTNDFRGSVYTYQKPSAFVANESHHRQRELRRPPAVRSDFRRTDRARSDSLLRQLGVESHRRRVGRHLGARPGHLRPPAEQRPAVLQARPPARLHQPARRPIQFQRQRPGGERSRRAEYLRPEEQCRGAHLERGRLLGRDLGSEQGQRAPGPVHPGSRGLLQPSHLRYRRRIPRSRFLPHPVSGDHPRGRGKRRARPRFPPEPRREATAGGESLSTRATTTSSSAPT